MERKSRMPQIQGGEGEAVVNYREPSPTQKKGCHRLSRRVNKEVEKGYFHNVPIDEISSF
jgi:hypothetical protein